MTNEAFLRRLSGMPDEELRRIANSQPDDGYETFAVEAAVVELDHRGLSHQELSRIDEQIAQEQKIEIGRSDEPLSNWLWLCFAVLGPLMLVTITGAIILWARGYRRKSKDAFSAIIAGFFLWGLVAVAFAILANH